MTAAFDIVVPALALRQANGDIDVPATRRYGERAAATWVDYFIISGSTTRGQDLSPEQRADLLDLWLDVADGQRLLACCWTPDDIKNAKARGIAPMVTMRQLDRHANALAFLRQLPRDAYIYSHPLFGGAVFNADLATAARDADVLPAGGKIAKISTADVAAISEAAGPQFRLWDGSSRRIQASLEAGVAGVVATPLCAFDTELPAKEPTLVQAAVDPVQAALDEVPDRASRTAELMRRATAFR
jgi:dihydrodipicolinate synthase/N-acetylneuraminate lyase